MEQYQFTVADTLSSVRMVAVVHPPVEWKSVEESFLHQVVERFQQEFRRGQKRNLKILSPVRETDGSFMVEAVIF